MLQILDNVVWHALSGPHRHLSQGNERAARYQRDVTALAAFPDAKAPDLDALRPHCESGEQLYVLGWDGAVPTGWQTNVEATIVKMAWDAAFPSETPAFDPVRLTTTDVAQMQALADATNPGPFGSRTIELGEYVGYFAGDRLVAMAGERMHAAHLREISAVCTDPEYRGRGLARELMFHLVRHQLQRGERPFLHVLKHNERALGMYEAMGFRVYREMPARIVSIAP